MDSSIDIKNADLNEPKIRNKIFKYLINKLDGDQKIEPITKNKDLDTIRDNNYVICPRFAGSRSWIIFFSTKSNFYGVSFPKHNINKQSDIRIFPVGFEAKKKIYRGTIMEGVFCRENEERYFVVDEIHTYAGENQLLKTKQDRLRHLSDNLIHDFIMKNNFRLYISQVYSTKSQDIIELYSKIKADAKIQEIIFYPQIYGNKIYKYSVIDKDLNADVINLSKFEMHITPSPDVYNLIDINSEKKIGIAYIPDIATSKECKSWFKSNKTKKLTVNCKLHMEKNRWIPIEIVDD